MLNRILRGIDKYHEASVIDEFIVVFLQEKLHYLMINNCLEAIHQFVEIGLSRK
ncbi:hypothetical protein [Bacillus wiedmannii]|uniref:hypothetical protein n=1 Tax=Bacillus wiedmannii TaxID=1890302 RepID=UPI001484F32B|nr:hypothetical protein [Bacillus wiedmannii]